MQSIFTGDCHVLREGGRQRAAQSPAVQVCQAGETTLVTKHNGVIAKLRPSRCGTPVVDRLGKLLAVPPVLSWAPMADNHQSFRPADEQSS
jgi:antitoxin (DNA-binding transcriptional repressor) of toxin-antitoxin stability system